MGGWAKPSYKYEEEKKFVRREEIEVVVQVPRRELGLDARTDWVVGHGERKLDLAAPRNEGGGSP